MVVTWNILAIAACALRRHGLGAGIWTEVCNVTVEDLIRIFAVSIKIWIGHDSIGVYHVLGGKLSSDNLGTYHR